LQELAQRNAWPDSPAYELIEATGPSHAPSYTVKARVCGGYEAAGEGRTKRAAEVAAAQALLHMLNAEGLA
jgi:ribonuclease-3